MRKRRRILLRAAVALLAVVFVLALVLTPSSSPPEPSHKGRSLSEWLLLRSTNRDPGTQVEVEGAIRSIGTNGIPYYLKWLQNETPDSSWRIQVPTALAEVFAGLTGRPHPLTAGDKSIAYVNGAVYAFLTLGAQAREAIPELARVANDSRTTHSASRAAACLAFIGKDALPALASLLTNQAPHLRADGVFRLASLGTNARPAVTAVVNALADPSLTVRQRATNALRNIAPEVLTNAPPATTRPLP